MNPNTKDMPLQRAGADELNCPLCESSEVTTSLENETFTYGSGDNAVDLNVELPVRRCEVCDFEFIDHDGEQIQHEAVCRHLGVQTPTEVRAIRQRRRLTRAAFAKLTGFGQATLKRWESGAVVQNLANDRYLRLLDTATGWAMLAELTSPPSTQVPHTASHKNTPGPFRRLRVTQTIRAEQNVFVLRRAA